MQFFERIFDYKNAVVGNKAYDDVLTVILANLDKVRDSTIYEVAELCYTSPTTIGRMCRQLGYNGYLDFRSDLVYIYDNYASYNYLLPMEGGNTQTVLDRFCGNVEQTMACIRALDPAAIDAIVRLLHEQNEIFFCEFFPNPTAIYSLRTNLALTKKSSSYVSGSAGFAESVGRLTAECLVFFTFPDVEQAGFIWKYVREAHEKGAKVVLLLSGAPRVRPDAADVVIRMPSVGTRMDQIGTTVFWNILSFLYRKKWIDRNA